MFVEKLGSRLLIWFILLSSTLPAENAQADCVSFVESKVSARNIKDICKLMEEAGIPRDYSLQNLSLKKNGPVVHIFYPEWGNGNTGTRPSFHFELQKGKLKLIFQSWSSCGYLSDEQPINGRYLLMSSYYTPDKTADGTAELKFGGELWFWDGDAYVKAYKVERIIREHGPDKEIDALWDPKTGTKFQEACNTFDKRKPRHCNPKGVLN